MTGQPLLRIHTWPTGRVLRRVVHPVRGFLLWFVGAALAGAVFGLTVELLSHTVAGQPIQWSLVWQYILAVEMIVLTAVVGARHAFPHFEHLPVLLHYGMIVLTLLGGALLAGLISLATRPGIIFTRPLAFFALVAVNTLLAVMLSVALIAWDSLKRSLERAWEELRVKEAFEREMALAREVQQELLPEASPRIAGLDIAFTCRPAAAVGGDSIDFLELPEGRLGLVVGDVVGKGIAAALLMANLQSLVRALAPGEPSPARLHQRLSAALGRRGRPGRFVTLACVYLDPATGDLRYSLAGHHPPLVVGPAGVRELDRGGLPLGITDLVAYREGTDRLAPGETLLLFTDGLVEAPPESGADEEFGKQRLMDLARRHHEQGAEALLERVLEALAAWVGDKPAADDTTVLVVRRSEAAVLPGEGPDDQPAG
ncbi:MAG: PP2C family protein-serine/threonine phosphatase [Acidobacteriota bacterium]|nr:PP2C family protein-serine/threonine phosphatase [Acidobacteriota bacterium]